MKTTEANPWRLSVAPMMDWTDRHCRRNPAAKKDVWEDMKLFLKQAGLPVPA